MVRGRRWYKHWRPRFATTIIVVFREKVKLNRVLSTPICREFSRLSFRSGSVIAHCGGPSHASYAIRVNVCRTKASMGARRVYLLWPLVASIDFSTVATVCLAQLIREGHMAALQSEGSGASKGGKARASRLTAEERRAIAIKAANSRWSRENRDHSEITRASHSGELVIGELKIPCAVLEDGSRVLSARGVTRALGRSWYGGERSRAKADRGGSELPVFIAPKSLAPHITHDLVVALNQPKLYYHKQGGQPAHGVEATLLPRICEVWLKAREAGGLRKRQQHIAARAELLMRGLAHIGIIALVDDATGYTVVRDREELHRILEAYINKELLPWSKTFPDGYYQELFRLRDWEYSPPSVKRPHMVGKLTHDLVYKRLPHGVIEELKRRNPVNAQGRRRHKHFRFLTGDIGQPHLKEQVVSVTTLMRAARTWSEFERMFERAFPTDGVQGELFAPDEEEQDRGVVS